MAELIFGSVKDAIRWSEEVASIPDVRSCLGSMITKNTGSRISKQDIIEIAQTISHITAQVKPYAGLVMKLIYGRRSEIDEQAIALVIASRLLTLEASKDKQNRQLVAIGLCTLRYIRESELYGKRFPMRLQAKMIGVSRERLSTGKQWRELRCEAIQLVRDWMTRAEREIYPELKLRGWIG